ncbi:MAG TPA: HWE histidine kinase domain-containing protein [Phenylobacterium sp.]|uniref:sensor histidine kinase n=1 Tax=Phenylobacterium sp. TaxID=1871053 RepID=UPI002B4A6C0A|nr:HWE histidine kinase domain-containing protein [Phenylobacterium sp.]HKR88555.1 HWE histidine kinase domain-containing protein [Phenylobacterium sp.]
MPDTSARPVDPLDQRIGRALLRGRNDEGVLAVEDGQVVACTDHARELLGCEGRAVLGATVVELIDQLDGELLQLHLRRALVDETAVEFVVERPRRPDGWIEIRSLPLSPGVAFLLRDVTDRERSERAIRRKEQRLLAANRSLRLAHTAAHAASWEWRWGRSLRWLDLAAARELASLPPAWTDDEEIDDWRRVMPKAGRRAFDRAIKTLEAAGSASFELEVVGADGAQHWMRIDCAVTERDEGGTPTRISGVTVDITETKRADERLRAEVTHRKRSEERQQLLVHELNHRVKNMLATVQSVARQSLGSPELRGPARDFEERLMALAWAYEIITRERWSGASLREVIQRTMAPHMDRASNRLALDGPELWLSPNGALSLALAMHELATNAVKYGALSEETGHVGVRWRVRDRPGTRRLELEWRESGGPPVVPPIRRGFGSRLIERSLSRELHGEVKLDFEPSGLVCRVVGLLPQGA